MGFHGDLADAEFAADLLVQQAGHDQRHHVALARREQLIAAKALSPQMSYDLAEHASDDALTRAEVDVLRLIAAGNANKQIADRLSITEDTVKSRVKNILSKLSANDRTHAAMIGLKRGIIEFQP